MTTVQKIDRCVDVFFCVCVVGVGCFGLFGLFGLSLGWWFS